MNLPKEKINENIEIIYKSIYIKSLDLVAISDLQIGEELYLAKERGILVPQFQTNEMKNTLKEIFKETKAKKLLINGDVKHEFGKSSEQEWREVIDFINFAKSMFEEIIIVRGNHDNYLLNIINKLNVKFFQPSYLIKKFLFTHGHLEIKIEKDVEYLIIGHEEPSIVIREKISKIKFPCLLYGNYNENIKLICLPAFSPLSSGTEINMVNKNDLLSPILRKTDIDEMEVYVIDINTGIVRFPMLKFLKSNLNL